MRYFDSRTACQLAGLHRSTLKAYVAQRNLMIRPAVKGKGQGHRDLYNEMQVFGLVMMTNLRKRAVDPKSCVRAYHFLSAFSPDELLARFAEGRKYVLILDDEIVPRLVGIGAIQNNPDFSFEKARQFGISATVVDVEAGWHQFRGALQDQLAEHAAQAAANEPAKEPA